MLLIIPITCTLARFQSETQQASADISQIRVDCALKIRIIASLQSLASFTSFFFLVLIWTCKYEMPKEFSSKVTEPESICTAFGVVALSTHAVAPRSRSTDNGKSPPLLDMYKMNFCLVNTAQTL